MKAPLSLFLCLATLPLLSPGQTTPAGITNAPVLSSGNETSNLLFKPILPGELILDEPRQRAQHEASAQPGTHTGLRWDTPVQEKSPELSVAGTQSSVSGFLVNVFGPAPGYGEPLGWRERVFGTKKIRWFESEPPRPAKRQLEYFKWGEREQSWSVVCEGRRRPAEGELFSIHF